MRVLSWRHRKNKVATPKGQNALTRAVRELERLEIIAKGCIEGSTKGKLQLAMWLPPSG